jgi:hypothetical protein
MLDALELYTAWLEAQIEIDAIEDEVMSLFRGKDAETRTDEESENTTNKGGRGTTGTSQYPDNYS